MRICQARHGNIYGVMRAASSAPVGKPLISVIFPFFVKAVNRVADQLFLIENVNILAGLAVIGIVVQIIMQRYLKDCFCVNGINLCTNGQISLSKRLGGTQPYVPVIRHKLIRHADNKRGHNVFIKLFKNRQIFIGRGRIFTLFYFDRINISALND